MEVYDIKDPEAIILRDYLARDRTKLAAERTFLSYIRTALGIFSAGAAAVKFIDDSRVMYILGWIFLVISPIITVVGVYRFICTLRKINSIPDNSLIVHQTSLKAGRK